MQLINNKMQIQIYEQMPPINCMRRKDVKLVNVRAHMPFHGWDQEQIGFIKFHVQCSDTMCNTITQASWMTFAKCDVHE